MTCTTSRECTSPQQKMAKQSHSELNRSDQCSSLVPLQERTRLRETSTRVQGEALQLREEREALQVAVEVSRRETAEARALWEMEIKSRASVSLRVCGDTFTAYPLPLSPLSSHSLPLCAQVLDLEKSHQQSAPTIETVSTLSTYSHCLDIRP